MIYAGEKEAAIKKAERMPAAGETIQHANPERPVIGYWVGMNGCKSYVGKKVYSTGTVQGYATGDLNEAAGYISAGAALMDLDELGYYDHMRLEEYSG
ncbi:hypothetical protein NPJ88_000080 [Halomonas elongata]|uniref:hypothetical protein n=1 Tax=Halomonas elongata TaxID=2746 RepID=UPI00255B21CB|nr:hypothetical protein [Halomonas elongata]MDL4860719.1 hypothetical protein [Halomonas elongata]